MSKHTSQHALAAKAIRSELKKFKIKASVRSRSYAGGNSVDVTIKQDILPATRAKIEEFANRFQMGSFNSMEDIYEYSNRNDDLPQVNYVFVSVNFSDEIKNEAKLTVVERFGGDMDSYEIQQYIRKFLTDDFYGFWTSRKPTIKVKAAS